jgi:hypothetical protein
MEACTEVVSTPGGKKKLGRKKKRKGVGGKEKVRLCMSAKHGNKKIYSAVNTMHTAQSPDHAVPQTFLL